MKLEQASTHKSAKTYAGTVVVPHDLDFWPFDPKINGLHGGLMVKHSISSSMSAVFEISCGKTDRQTPPKPLSSAWVITRLLCNY